MLVNWCRICKRNSNNTILTLKFFKLIFSYFHKYIVGERKTSVYYVMDPAVLAFQ